MQEKPSTASWASVCVWGSGSHLAMWASPLLQTQMGPHRVRLVFGSCPPDRHLVLLLRLQPGPESSIQHMWGGGNCVKRPCLCLGRWLRRDSSVAGGRGGPSLSNEAARPGGAKAHPSKWDLGWRLSGQPSLRANN